MESDLPCEQHEAFVPFPEISLPYHPSHFLLASFPCLAVVLLFCVLPNHFSS